MKYIQTIIITILGVFIFYLLWNNGEEVEQEKKVTEIEKEAFTPLHEIEAVEYINDTIRLKPTTKQLDSIKTALETQYKDSISVLNALAETRLKLIEETKDRKYTKTYDTDLYTLNITEYVKGYLDKREYILKIKPQKIKYIETHTETILKTKYSIYYGVGANTNATLNINIGVSNSKGNYFGIGVDTKSNFMFEYKHAFFTKY